MKRRTTHRILSMTRGLRSSLLMIVALAAGRGTFAANPASATIGTASSPATWQGTAVAGGAQSDPAADLFGSEDLCQEGVTCDTFTLTIAGTPADWTVAGKLVHVHLGWTVPTQDFDLYIHKGDLSGPVVASSGNGATNGILTSEDADLDPSSPSIGTGVFSVHVVYWLATAADQYTGTASAAAIPPPPPPPPSHEPEGTPRFYNYQAPPGIADFAGEPMIGVNRKSEKTFNGIPNGGTAHYFGGFLPYMLSATFSDALWPPKVSWQTTDLTVATAPRLYGDPYLYTDQDTGRTFVAQEMGKTPAGSTMEWTDDDGGTFLPSEGSGAPSGIDHETIGGGPYHDPIPSGANPLYPNGVWYCSQSIVDAVCSLSLDGGMTFGPAFPMYSLVDCIGLHGHIKIGPDGTAYVPNVSCGANQAVIVSENNGVTWSVRRLPQSSAADRDPAVAVGSDGTLYFAYQNGDGHSHVAVSRDRGLSWETDTDVGAQLGIKNSVFHAAAAGDGDRAAIAFFGTTTPGTDYDTPGFSGDWYLYVATTFDRGHTWWTQNVTPADPIQRGGICTDGACRNLLDFFGVDIDKEGRVLIGYDDGCISNACITGRRSYGLPGGNDFTAKGVIARQTGGKRMYAAFDPPAGPVAQPPARPLPPPAAATCDGLVANDSTGDAFNPVLSTTGSADQQDLTSLSFGLGTDGQSLVTTVTLKDFSTVPAPGSAGAYYRVVWTSAKKNADGSITSATYATEAKSDASGVAYRYGQYDPAGNAFVGTALTATGSYTTGAGGTIKVNVPLAYLGNPTIPVTDASALPAVIEPYALVFAHEQALYFVAPVDRAPDYGFAGSNWAVCLPPTREVVEDTDPRISYSDGWHTVNASGASGGHYRFHAGSSPSHWARLTFNVDTGRTGKITYVYGTSSKGGSADVRLDGVSRTVSYAGGAGAMKDPVLGATVEFANLTAGPHTLEIVNMTGAVYVDGFVLESSQSNSQPTGSGPGETTSGTSTLSPGQVLASSLPIGTGASAISVVAESAANLPIKLMLVGPTGSLLQTAASTNGVAVINAPISGSGTYIVKVVNLNLGPVQVWTAATPTIRR